MPLSANDKAWLSTQLAELPAAVWAADVGPEGHGVPAGRALWRIHRFVRRGLVLPAHVVRALGQALNCESGDVAVAVGTVLGHSEIDGQETVDEVRAAGGIAETQPGDALRPYLTTLTDDELERLAIAVEAEWSRRSVTGGTT